jgi:hypothetical protein
MSKFVNALTNLVRQIMRKFAQDRAHYYMDRVASTSDGRMYALSNGTDAIALNGGKFLPGESVLVIRTDTGQQFLYYFNPTSSPEIEEAEVLTILVIMYYTTTALKYAIITPNGDTESADLPLMSATMTLPTGADTANVCLYRRDSSKFTVYDAFALPENIVSYDATKVYVAVSAATVTSTFDGETITGTEYLGTGTASMSAFTDASHEFTHTVSKEPSKGITCYVFTSNALQNIALMQQTYPLILYGPNGLIAEVTSADYLTYPYLENFASMSCYALVSGAEYVVGEYTSGTVRGGVIFKRFNNATSYLYFDRVDSTDTEFILTPSGSLVSKGYMRTLADMSIPPSALATLPSSTDAGTFTSALYVTETGSTDTVVSARTVPFDTLSTFSKFPEAYTRYETTLDTYQVHRHAQPRGSLLGGTSLNVRTWNGGVWGHWLPQVNGRIRDMVYDSTGDLWVVGSFTMAGDTPANCIARWDGTKWNAVGGGVTAGYIRTLAFDNAGTVYVGGRFTEVDGVACQNLAKYDGSWVPIGANGDVYSIVNYGGDMVVGGYFYNVNDTPNIWRIAIFNGSTWSALGGGLATRESLTSTTSGVTRMLVVGSRVYIGGHFYSTISPTVNFNGVTYWDGSNYNLMGTGGFNNSQYGRMVNEIVSDSGIVYFAGDFDSVDMQSSRFVASWDGSAWMPLPIPAVGYNTWASGICVATDGKLYVTASTTGGDALLRRDGSAWTQTQAGVYGVGIYKLLQEA